MVGQNGDGDDLEGVALPFGSEGGPEQVDVVGQRA
jgi:hypothetical protein